MAELARRCGATWRAGDGVEGRAARALVFSPPGWLSASERDEAQAHLARLESEVVSLQRHVARSSRTTARAGQKATLAAANHKLVRAQASAFEAQAVEQGLQNTTSAE